MFNDSVIQSVDSRVTHYFHYPLLDIEGEEIGILNGMLQHLPFEVFERLDGDWSNKAYFERTQPVCWIVEMDERATGEKGADQGDDLVGEILHIPQHGVPAVRHLGDALEAGDQVGHSHLLKSEHVRCNLVCNPGKGPPRTA